MISYINLEPTKECWSCGQEKHLTSFYVCNTRPDGRSSECKTCQLLKKKKAWKTRRKTISEYDLRVKILEHANLTKETWDNLHRWGGEEILTIFKKCLNDLETHTTNA